MGVISQVVCGISELDARYGVDPLMLTSEERANGHFMAETASGRTVRISLPRGTELQDGDVLAIDGDWAVVVRAAEEDLILVTPRDDAVQWAAACYQLGNLHRPARFLEAGVLTLADPMALQILKGLDIGVESVCRPFTGRRFGAAGAHHHHEQPPVHHHHHDDTHALVDSGREE